MDRLELAIQGQGRTVERVTGSESFRRSLPSLAGVVEQLVDLGSSVRPRDRE